MIDRVRKWWNGRPDPVRKNNKDNTYTITYRLGKPDHPWIRRQFSKYKKFIILSAIAVIALIAKTAIPLFTTLIITGSFF